MSIITLSVVTIAGALAFAMSSNAKLTRAGQLTLTFGLFWLVFVLMGMHMGIVVPLAVAVAGALAFVLSTNIPLAKIGETALAIGLFWLVAMLGGVNVHF